MSNRFYYMPKDESLIRKMFYFFHPSAKRVSQFPANVLIQTVSGCNARCVFCPENSGANKLPVGKMEWPLYKKIVDECVENPVKLIMPYLMNESLLDKNLGEKIRYISDKRKRGLSTRINTNASLLNEEMRLSLIDSGLDRLHVSCHGISKEAYETSMKGLQLENTLSNVDKFLELKKKRGASKPKVTVTMVKTKIIEQEIPQIKEYWSKRGVSVHIRPLENRADQNIAKKGLEPEKWKRFSWCKRLFSQGFILWNGDMILCCVDYGYTTVLGNVAQKSIKEVWNSEKAVDIRRRFLSGKTDGLLCATCLKQSI